MPILGNRDNHRPYGLDFLLDRTHGSEIHTAIADTHEILEAPFEPSDDLARRCEVLRVGRHAQVEHQQRIGADALYSLEPLGAVEQSSLSPVDLDALDRLIAHPS